MNLAQAFPWQADSNEALGSPFTARVLRLIADRLKPGTPVMDAMFAFSGDVGPYRHSVPLRLLGGLHALVLANEAPDLAAAYPPNPTPDDATLGAALDRALAEHQTRLLEWLASPPQTNEVRRSIALIAGAALLSRRYGKPFVLSELGASAGLNLYWDRYALAPKGWRIGPAAPALTLSPDWSGAQPPAAHLSVTERRGVDLNPVDPHDPDQRLRLLSYLWADQRDRIDLTRKAIAVTNAEVDKGDASDWLARRLATHYPGHIHLVTHTIAWQYFPDHVQAACLATFEEAGRRAAPDAPLARIAMEADEGGPGAGLTLTTWPGGVTETLGRVDFHGRWLDWRAT
ncbi:DUF2332 domain-containing protein [Maritimibacter dapengensis]|uniref:DUF2332 family protein n=1 Tax=Maritimibacter dapengensis TaxID=2836868 RepID=A0ABS6T062_9RHOB|nr:DUF2332 family protein [Maritimibacter dapengensis]MBV7378575.1 DUF2332 family protein [Maritimibacter dapengensis]